MPWQAILPAGQAYLHVEDQSGLAVDDAYVSWVCQSDHDRGPEIRIPVTGGERIRARGECYFQATDADGIALSDDLSVTLDRGDVTDIWLVVD